MESIGIRPLVRPVATDEFLVSGKSPKDQVMRIAEEKHDAYFRTHAPDDSWVLTADTLVFLSDEPLAKPASSGEAAEFLRALSGKVHEVWTGFSLSDPDQKRHLGATKTEVEFRNLAEADLSWYLRTGEWEDAAGGYRIQSAGAALILGIRGSYSNVVGLPLESIYGILSGNP